MASSSATLHEEPSVLGAATIDRHRAIVSLMEELEATRTLRHFLAARPLIGFDGPGGWDRSAHNLGRVDPLPAPAEGVEAARRRVQPLVELRTPFELSLAELDAVDRGAAAPDLDAV